MLCFVTSAAIWLLLEAEFLAVVLVLVYVGAVMVLFLFVVMMLDIDLEALREGFTRFAWLGWLTAVAVIVEIVGVVWSRGGLGIDASHGGEPTSASYSNTLELGRVLYTTLRLPARARRHGAAGRDHRRHHAHAAPPSGLQAAGHLARRWRCGPRIGCAS